MCPKPFSWYLKEVVRDHYVPDRAMRVRQPSTFFFWGEWLFPSPAMLPPPPLSPHQQQPTNSNTNHVTHPLPDTPLTRPPHPSPSPVAISHSIQRVAALHMPWNVLYLVPQACHMRIGPPRVIRRCITQHYSSSLTNSDAVSELGHQVGAVTSLAAGGTGAL